jgi:flagellin
MSSIVLSAGVRQNLLSLQNTAALAATTENRLATGKKVNSALDNPQSFFTSQSLLNRSTDLSSLLDQIGQAQQTLQAANQGLTSLTNLVQSAKSLANQALQASKGALNYTGVSGTAAIAADTTQLTSTSTVANATIVASTQAAFTATDANVTALTANATVAVTINGESHTFTKVANGSSAAAGTFTTGAQLAATINDTTAGFGTSTKAVAVNSAGTTTVTGNDVTSNFTIAGTGAATLSAASTSAVQGDALTVSDGTHTNTFYKVASGANTAAGVGTFTTIADLTGAINASTAGSGNSGGVTASSASGALKLASTGTITVGGTGATDIGLASGTTTGNYNSTLAGLSGGSVSIQIASDTAHTITFGTGGGQISTKAGLSAALAAATDLSGSIDATGHVQLTGTSTNTITVSGTSGALTGLGLQATTTTPVATVVTADTTRSNLQGQYNNLLTQIDQLANDSSYNGVNLLKGDNLKVTFNETNTSSLTIQGVTFNSGGLGLTQVSGNGFQDNTNVNNTISSLNTALTSLRTQAAQFGSTLSTVQTRQSFTTNLVNVLQTGSDSLVLADSNQEGANLLALQTRQQLSTTALSLANQANQAVLRLFG